MPVQKNKYFDVQAGHGRLFWEFLLGQPRLSFSNLLTHVVAKREPCAEKRLVDSLVWPAKVVFFEILQKSFLEGPANAKPVQKNALSRNVPATESEPCAAKRLFRENGSNRDACAEKRPPTPPGWPAKVVVFDLVKKSFWEG
jgi:hypothetical protein